MDDEQHWASMIWRITWVLLVSFAAVGLAAIAMIIGLGIGMGMLTWPS